MDSTIVDDEVTVDEEEDLLEDCLYDVMIATKPGFIPCSK